MPQPMINVDGLCWFNGVGDVVLTGAGKVAATAEPERLLNALRLAAEYSDNEILNLAANGIGPLARHEDMDFEEFLVVLEEAITQRRQETGARNAKIAALRTRRAQFGANRSALVLKMLAAGTPYRCVHPGCAIVDDLTVDHRMPVSLGGTDDLENLQFMCLPHNAAKGNRI